MALLIGFGCCLCLGQSASMAYLQGLNVKYVYYLIHLPALFWSKNPSALTDQLIQWVDVNIFIKLKTLIQSGQERLALLQPAYMPLPALIQMSVPYLINGLTVFILVTQLIFLRLLTLVLFLPVFALAGCVGLTDGLIQRNLRRLRGGRESALLYHCARSALMPLLFWSTFLYLVLPFYLAPAHFLLPFAIAFAVVVWLAAKFFKKYL